MKKQDGQTLMEVLLAFGVLMLTMSAVIFGVATSLSNAQYTKNQSLANFYAQEGMAVVKKIRDSNLNEFINYYTSNTIYCLGSQIPLELKPLTLSNCFLQSPVPVGGNFSREIIFSHGSESCCSTGAIPCPVSLTKGSQVTVTVSWQDNKCPVGNAFCHKVRLITCFSTIDRKPAP